MRRPHQTTELEGSDLSDDTLSATSTVDLRRFVHDLIGGTWAAIRRKTRDELLALVRAYRKAEAERP